MQIGRLFGLQQFGVERRGRHQVAQAQAGRQNFRKRAQVDTAFGVARRQRRRGRLVKPQVAVGVVFEQWQAGVLRDLDHLGAAGFGHAAPGRVLEVGQQVGKARTGRLSAQVLRHHAFVVRGHADNLRLHRGEGLQGAQIGGALDQHLGARIDQHFGHQVQTLLRAGGDQHLCGLHREALPAQVISHPFA